MHRVSFAAVALTVALATSCNSTPTAPSTTNVAGTWSGTTCAPNRPAACAIQFTISQEGSSVTGTYGSTTFGGTLSGTVSGSTVSLLMTPTFPPGRPAYTLSLTVIGDQMIGPYGESTISLSR
jgi:hypothetical protein